MIEKKFSIEMVFSFRSKIDPRRKTFQTVTVGDALVVRDEWQPKKETVIKQEEEKELGFGDLFRFYHRNLRAERDDYTTHNVSKIAVKRYKSSFPDCDGHDRDVEAGAVPVHRPGGDVPGEHAAAPGQGAAGQRAGEHPQ